MEIDVQREKNRSIVRIAGDIDLSNSPRLRETLLNLFRKRRQKLVIVDLSRVQHVESSAIASLIEAHRESEHDSARLVLVGVHEAIRSVLELSNLLDVFEIYPSIEDVAERRP